MRGLRVFRLASGLALLLVLFGASLSQASAGGGGDLVIHNRICPVEYAGDALFDDCHDNPQTSNLEFSVSGPESATAPTDANGNVTFADLTPGAYDVSGGVPGEFASAVVFCSAEGNPDTLVEALATATGFSVSMPADFTGSIICDWYNIPFDLKGDGGDDGGVTELPDTGAGTVADSNTSVALYGILFVALGGAALAMRRRAIR